MIRTAMFILRIQWYTLAIGPGSLVDNPDPLTWPMMRSEP